MTTQFEFVRTEIVDGVYVLTVDRPAKLNAITAQVELDWLHAIDEAAADPDAAVILQRAEGRVFSAGHDLGEVGGIIASLGADAADWQHVYDRIWPEGSALEAVQRCAKPIVSAVQGQVVGQSVFQVLATDLVVAAPGTIFNLEVMRTGGAAGAAALVGLLPAKMVNQIAYTGRLSAEQLLRVGAINDVVAADLLDTTALNLARDVARVHPTSLASYKAAFTERLQAQHLAEFAAGFDDIRASHGNDDDNAFWARAASQGVKDALRWRDDSFGPTAVDSTAVGSVAVGSTAVDERSAG